MSKIKSFLSDFSLGAIGLVVMNGVVSLLVYPIIGNELGAAMQGRIMFYTSLIALMAAAFGNGANYGRMKIFSGERKTVNGDYNIFLLASSVIIILVTILAICIKGESAETNPVFIIILMLLTVLRYYTDVQYRLSLNYKRFALYYVVIALGYCAGIGIFKFTGSWVVIFLAGEIAGLIYAFFTGNALRKPFFERSKQFKSHMGTMSMLAGSYLLSDFVVSADRIMLPVIVPNGDEISSIFYYASLFGKTMSLLSAPLNGVLAGYISKKEGGLSKKNFGLILLIMLGLWVVFTGISFAGSHLFVYLFYRDYYGMASPLFLLANAGQVIFFICNTLMVVVLRYTHERNQIIVGVGYIIAFFAISIPLTQNFGVYGMAWGILIVNVFKFVLFAVLGLIALKNGPKEIPENRE